MDGKRNISLDVIRIFALFSVISVHFFLNSGFYNVLVKGERMYVLVLIRQFFMICVPLFMILTGYLMSSKILSKKYFWGIRKTLFVYVLASIVCIVYKNVYLNYSMGFKETILGILSFSAANYAWYIEMYVGLFLLIPFLNLIYNGLDGKKQKQFLLLIFFLLTSAPTVINIYRFSEISWWLNPISSGDYQKLIPSWWDGIYPVLYYFIGAYLKEFGLNISEKKSVCILGIVILAGGTFAYYRSYGGNFVWGSWTGYESLFVVIMSTLVFNGILNMKWINKLSTKNKYIIMKMSEGALGAYLLSYIFDSLVYPYFSQKVDGLCYRFQYYFIIVPIVFLCSMIVSWCIDFLYKRIMRLSGTALSFIK